jgi:hypothetical protein
MTILEYGTIAEK